MTRSLPQWWGRVSIRVLACMHRSGMSVQRGDCGGSGSRGSTGSRPAAIPDPDDHRRLPASIERRRGEKDQRQSSSHVDEPAIAAR